MCPAVFLAAVAKTVTKDQFAEIWNEQIHEEEADDVDEVGDRKEVENDVDEVGDREDVEDDLVDCDDNSGIATISTLSAGVLAVLAFTWVRKPNFFLTPANSQYKIKFQY